MQDTNDSTAAGGGTPAAGAPDRASGQIRWRRFAAMFLPATAVAGEDAKECS